MERLFTQAEVDWYLADCRQYLSGEFGDEYCMSVERLQLYKKQGVRFYQPYGEIINSQPKIYGLGHALLISYDSLRKIKEGSINEIDLDPWEPRDGAAVLWIAGVTSDRPGVAAKCIGGILDQVDQCKYKDKIDKVALLSTGPQGYLMAGIFELNDNGFLYGDGWTVMERDLAPQEIARLGFRLADIWSMTKARDVVRTGRRLWGKDWRSYSLQLAELDKGRS